MRGKLFFFISLFILLDKKIQAQEYTPEDYELASQYYIDWPVLGLHHETLLGATPIGRYRRVLKTIFPNIPLKFSNEFGYSCQKLPLTKDMMFAQQVYGSDQSDGLVIHRLQFSQAYAFDLLQSINLAVIDVYAGLRILNGSAQFEPSPDDFEFQKKRYKSGSNPEQFYGVILMPTESTRIAAQFNKLDEKYL